MKDKSILIKFKKIKNLKGIYYKIKNGYSNLFKYANHFQLKTQELNLFVLLRLKHHLIIVYKNKN